MTHNWILDVLTDLKTFAATNGLPALADQLEDTQLVAMAEIEGGDKGLNSGSYDTQRANRDNIGGVGTRQRA